MKNRDALIALRDAVKAGEWDQSAAWTSFGIGRCSQAERAYHGSLYAAKALHEAVLPGWYWHVNSADDRQHHAANVSRDEASSFYFVTAPNPARAWLLAILEALIAEAA
jgi:hypothetical protein